MQVLKVAKTGEISRLVFSPDSTLCVSGEMGVSLWDVPTGQRRTPELAVVIPSGDIWFHPSGRWLFGPSAEPGLAAYDFTTGTAATVSHGVSIGRLRATRDGNTVVCYWFDRDRIFYNGYERYTWSPDAAFGSGWTVETFPESDQQAWNCGLAVLADGERFVTIDHHRGNGPRLAFRSIATGKVQESSPIDVHDNPALAVSPDDSLIVVTVKATLFVFDTGDISRPRCRIKSDNAKHFTAIAFHPGGKYLAATSNDATVKLYDTTSWKIARAFTWDIGRMRSVVFSPDGALAAAGSDKGKVVVWDVDL